MSKLSLNRILSIFLCASLLLCMIPNNTKANAKSYTVGKGTNISDIGSINDWETYFDSDIKNTADLNRIWTDKSVFTSAQDFIYMQNSATTNNAYNSLSIDENNFLVSLSAMASTAQITGYAGTPTDTVLILDLSQSMDNSGYIPTLITAANDAITTLLEQNKHNRISVILYSGNSATNEKANLSNAVSLLPLDRYTPNSSMKFLEYTGSSDTTVKVASGVKNSSNKTVSGSKQTVGGTYIQSGLYLASKEFETAYNNGTTVISDDLFQSGAKRIPVITLMSDGLPTIATDEYCTFQRHTTSGYGQNQTTIYGVTNQGNGSSNNNTITFLTQLTAKWLKESASGWYDNEALFYSVWIKSKDSTNNATLDPSISNDTLDAWWKTFLATQSGDITFKDGNSSFTVTRDNVIGNVSSEDTAWETEQNYVDKAFTATNATDFKDAFSSIVNTINVQSMRYPTRITTTNTNTDGYITITDPLGEFMEVKELKGINIGGYLFGQDATVKMLDDIAYGQDNTLSEEETAFLGTLQNRLGLSGDIADTLIKNAIENGQIGQNTENGKYTSFIEWYCDNDNNYLGFKSNSNNIIPIGATKTVKNYIFYGDIEKSVSDSNITGNNLMFLFVDVITDISSGNQTIKVSIPASLLPLIIYKLEINASSSLNSASAIDYSKSGATSPIRILAEVGLRDDINELSISSIMEQSNYTNIDKNGKYIFYTNRFGNQKATVHYQPSNNNPGFYYDSDTKIYSDTNGTLYNSSQKPANNTFYRDTLSLQFTKASTVSILRTYQPIAPSELSFAQKNEGDNSWFIPADTPLEIDQAVSLPKQNNITNTHEYISYRAVPTLIGNVYDVYEQLGNNGVTILGEPCGIKLTKKLTQSIENANNKNFVFDIDFQAPELSTLPDTVKVSYDSATYTDISINDLSVTIDADQSVFIYGLPDGSSYTITERPHENYAPVQNEIKDKIIANTITEVEFYNRPVYKGGIEITKAVNHPFGTNDQGLSDLQFTFTAQIKDSTNKALAKSTIYTSSGEMTSNEDGIINFNLKNNQSFTITNLPDNYHVIVTETNIPNGFTADNTVKEATISNGGTEKLSFTNTYSPAAIKNADIDIIGTKILNGRDWQSFDSYSFYLEYFNGSSWIALSDGANSTATKANPDFSLSDVIKSFTFDHEGEYKFRISERQGDLGGITYDSEPRPFIVKVEDNWNGSYEIVSVAKDDPRVNITTATQNNDIKYTIETNFTNSYRTTDTYLDINGRKQLIGDRVSNYSGQSAFNFNLYSAKLQGDKVTKDNFIINAAADSNGNFNFNHSDISALCFSTEGTYYYILEEATYDTDNLMVFDNSQYEIKAVVSDNLSGNLTTDISIVHIDAQNNRTAVDNIVFTNTKKPEPIMVTLGGEKKYNMPLTEGMFSFSLYKASLSGNTYTPEENAIFTRSNSADGSFEFKDTGSTKSLTFDRAGKYHFAILENLPDGVTTANPKKDGITYDTSVYGITIDVTEQTNSNGRAVLEYEILVNGKADGDIVFQNRYKPITPVGVVIDGKKTFDGQVPEDGAFTFELYNATILGEEIVISGDAINTKTSTNGVFTFDRIGFTSLENIGEHYYAVKENIPDSDTQIIYDTSVYFIKVTVSVDDDRNLLATTEIILNNQAVEEICFANETKPSPPTPPSDDQDEPDEPENESSREPSSTDDNSPEPEPEPPRGGDEIVSPQTADMNNYRVWYMLFASSALILLITLRKKETE